MGFMDYLSGAKGGSNPDDSYKDQQIIADPKSTPEQKKAAIARSRARLNKAPVPKGKLDRTTIPNK
jgi:hypothetical protein